MVKTHLLAACGLYCGACYHYRAGLPEGAHLLSDVARGGRPLDGYTCRGCWSDQLYVHLGCRACDVRACATRRGYAHCGECAELPCERLRAFQTDGRKHHLPIVAALRAAQRVGAEAWLAAEAARWTCPACGAGFTWYETRCAVCGASLGSYGEDVPLVRGTGRFSR